MILAIDPGLAKCGWAIVEPGTGAVQRCGVITTERDQDAIASVDCARRLARVITNAIDHGPKSRGYATALAAEAPLYFGPIQAVAPQIALWGALVAMAQVSGIHLYEVTAKTWQHAIMPEVADAAAKARKRGKIDYKQLEAKLAAYMGREALAHIPKPDRTHALDAVGVGVLVALRPELATLI